MPDPTIPTIRNWRITRSGAGLTLHGGIDGRIGKISATSVTCVDGEMVAFRDQDCVAMLSLETPTAYLTRTRDAA